MVKYTLSIERLTSGINLFSRRFGIIRLLDSIPAHRSVASFCVLLILFCNTLGAAWANPEGGNVAAGSVTIQQTTPSRLDVLQQSDKAIIDWQGFDIDIGEHTNFQQPSSSAITLNRVQSHDPSHILGRLTANGQIFLVNPNGLFFGRDSQTDVAGLVATTAGIKNQDFLNGRYVFDIAPDNPNAAVVNRGQIHSADNGFVVLAAPSVSNEGQMHARLGKVSLAGTNTFTVDFEGDGLLTFGIGSDVTQQPADENSKVVDALVSNSGQILVDGGIVEMTARTAEALVANVINMDGVIQARSVEERNGTIILSGGPAGFVDVKGTLDASGSDAGQTGGTVKVLGEKVGLFDGARINVSGDADGGEALVGGNYQGMGPEPNASHTYVANGTVINADALNNGDGGKIIVWANEAANIQGKLTARGGAMAGDGGLVETSARESVKITSSPDASAPNGKGGSWLIDPTDITIVASGGQIGSNTVGADLISNALNDSTDVELSTVSGSTDLGNITQNTDAVIEKIDGSEATLTLRAENDIRLNAGITSTSNPLNVIINADSDEGGAGSIVISAGAEIISNGGDIVLGGGTQPLISPAVGTTSNFTGVELDNARLSSGVGNITINGRGADDLGDGAFGILLANGAVIESTTGKISLWGTGGAGAVNDSSGIVLLDDSRITTQDGPVRLDGEGTGKGNLTGFRPGRNHGIDLEGTATIEATGNGIIQLVGKHTGEAIATADGNLGILLGDIGSVMEPKITTNTGSIAITGESNAVGFPSFGISIQANSAIQSLGGADINLTGTANADQGIFTINNGHIATSGLTTFDASGNDIVMSSSSPNDFGAVDITSARNATLNDINDIDLGSMSLTGDLEINAAGTVTMAASSGVTTMGGAINLNGAAIDTSAGTLDSSSEIGDGGDISLTTQGGDITTSTLTSAALGSTSGGDIFLTVDGGSGSIDTTAGLLDSRASFGGNISLTAPSRISVAGLDASGSVGTGHVELTGNEIDLLGGNASVQGQGELSLQTYTQGQDITLGGSDNTDVNVLELTLTDLDALADEFTSVDIQTYPDTGTISIDPAGISFGNPLSLSGEGINANGPITLAGSLSASAPAISVQDVITTGYQSYAGSSVIFNGDYITNGGIFIVGGNITLASDTSITTDGGYLAFGESLGFSALNGPGALTLATGATGDIYLNSDVGTSIRPSSITVTSARDISLIGSSIIAGPTEFHYTGHLISFDSELEVDSLYLDPSAASATLFGTVGGFSGLNAASVVSGPIEDPDFTINGYVISKEPKQKPPPTSPYVIVEPSYQAVPELELTETVEEFAALIPVAEGGFVRTPQEFNMSHFTIEAGIKAGWPMIVDFELAHPGMVEIEIISGDAEPVTFSLPGSTERNTTIVTIPQRIGDRPKLASINITATERDSSDIVPLRLYSIGAGPKAIGGSAAIDEIQINPPYLRADAHESSAYRFLSHSDFDTVMVDFYHVSPGATGDNYRSVNNHLISEGVEADNWIGMDEQRIWNGRDENEQISAGLHKLQIRAWDDVGQWLTVWSESFLEVR